MGLKRILQKLKLRYGSQETVIRTLREMGVQFNARGRKSPVTIGLYDIKPKDGQYKYENRW